MKILNGKLSREEDSTLTPTLLKRVKKKMENIWKKWRLCKEEDWDRKQMLRGKRRRFTSCGVCAKVACIWSSSGGLLPWRYWKNEGGVNKKPHRFHGQIIIPSACFSIVIVVEYLHARTVPKWIVKRWTHETLNTQLHCSWYKHSCRNWKS